MDGPPGRRQVLSGRKFRKDGDGMKQTLRRSPNRNNHQARNSSVSRRVDQSLGFVADQMAHALGVHCADQESHLLRRRLLLRELHYTPFLDLKYHFENRLMAISYNLELSTEIPVGTRFREWGECSFTVRQEQRGRERSVQWVCVSGADVPERARTLEQLNHPLIQERIQTLELREIQAAHTAGSDSWQISCESLIGSATWILIPPTVHLIKPSEAECLRFVEFFELVADAVANNQ